MIDIITCKDQRENVQIIDNTIHISQFNSIQFNSNILLNKFLLRRYSKFCNNFKTVHLFIIIVKFANLGCEYVNL